jgi:transposase-like protein
VRQDEQEDILSLVAVGYTVAEVARTLDRDPGTVARAVASHRKALRDEHAAEFHQLFHEAAKVAASNGDAKPALEWLDRMGAIPETSRQRTQLQAAGIAADAQRDVTRHLAKQGNGQGPTVNIGIALPSQLPASLGDMPQYSITTNVPQKQGEIVARAIPQRGTHT